MNHLSWTKKQLWEGCMLAKIAHAVMAAHYPEFDYEHSWDGMNYGTISDDGFRGTITFGEDLVIGAFKKDYNHQTQKNEAADLLKGAPNNIIEVAQEETFLYLLENVNGETKPVVDVVFWGNDQQVFSNCSEDEFMEQTNWMLEQHLKPFEEALEFWVENYEMNGKQKKLTKILYDKKKKNPTTLFTLTEKEIKMIGKVEDFEVSIESFSQIGFILE